MLDEGGFVSDDDDAFISDDYESSLQSDSECDGSIVAVRRKGVGRVCSPLSPAFPLLNESFSSLLNNTTTLKHIELWFRKMCPRIYYQDSDRQLIEMKRLFKKIICL